MGMCSQNEHTGQLQKTKPYSKEGRDNYDLIDWSNAPWRKKEAEQEQEKEEEPLIP